ncbi:FAD:protein FMN transferase [Leptobacterium sp. I13]|uniref:FAD:protein FMN transferase n=1 Tax=Leptobacterium meishanense TaxID=3128904 RepID=UPI0030EBBB80
MKSLLSITKVLSKYELLKSVFTLFISISIIGCTKHSEVIYRVEQGYALGTTYNIKYEVKNDSINLKDAIEDIFKHVNKSMSTYLPTSDISRINKGDSTIVIDTLFKEVYIVSKDIWKKTDGTFDPTVGSLVNAWGFGPENPLNDITQKQVDSILTFVGFDKVALTNDNRIVKNHPSIFLDFNAIAKGYTIDLIGRLFNEKGIENYLIELGGEILTKGKNSKLVKDWVVAIDHPLQTEEKRTLIAKVKLEDKAMATSGNYRKFRIDKKTGAHYVHTIDTKTGYPKKSNVLSVSVIAPTCMEADAYATALMVMDLEKAKQLLKQLNGIDAYIIIADKDGDIEKYTTKGFQELLID